MDEGPEDGSPMVGRHRTVVGSTAWRFCGSHDCRWRRLSVASNFMCNARSGVTTSLCKPDSNYKDIMLPGGQSVEEITSVPSAVVVVRGGERFVTTGS